MKTSTTRSSLAIFNQVTKDFEQKFGFYLDALDQIYQYQSKIGLLKSELSALPEQDQNIIKSFLFLVESSNTTSIGALRLFSSNLFSDAYSLLRILYEIASLIHYGNLPDQNKIEIYQTLFMSGLPEKEHKKKEWKLIQKSERKLESERPDYNKILKELNNFGGHISGAKIILGNVSTLGNAVASRVFTSNFNNSRFFSWVRFFVFLINVNIGRVFHSFK
ncbi:hypothetical protein JYT44_02765 [Caldithrix abyssi]|nr:hypothetical protein [Caldithrix abyssi]